MKAILLSMCDNEKMKVIYYINIQCLISIENTMSIGENNINININEKQYQMKEIMTANA